MIRKRLTGIAMSAYMGMTYAITISTMFALALPAMLEVLPHRLRNREERGVAIVELLLILMILIGIVFGVMKLLGGAVSGAGSTTSNCITTPTATGC